MSVDRDIKSAIQKIAGVVNDDKVIISVGRVKSVDEDKSTCIVTILNNKLNVDLPNVNLQVGVCDGLQIIPKVDSDVLVIQSTYNQPYIIQYSDIDKVYLQVGDSYVLVKNDNNIELLGDSDNLVRYSELETAFNQLKQDFNDFITIYNTHTHSGVQAGAGVTGTTSGTGSSSSADITGAKIDEIKTL